MNELRQDPSSGDWVIIASRRAGRPSNLDKEPVRRVPAPRSACPFENLETSGNMPVIRAYPNEKHWKVVTIPNKFPALEHGAVCSVPFKNGFYSARTGVGFHDLVVTRDHNRQFVDLDPGAALKVMEMFQAECRRGLKDPCITYVVPFYNFGKNAGASIWHPHYQVLATPIIPAHAGRSLVHTEAYFKKYHRCVRCDVIKAEEKDRTRIVAENKHAIALAPYASKLPFEVRIMPKRHYPFFYKTPVSVMKAVTALVQDVLKRMRRELADPDINLFVHEAPLDGGKHEHHHWHVELFPRISTPAGFEFSTGIYINAMDPEGAALVLRGQKKNPHKNY